MSIPNKLYCIIFLDKNGEVLGYYSFQECNICKDMSFATVTFDKDTVKLAVDYIKDSYKIKKGDINYKIHVYDLHIKAVIHDNKNKILQKAY